MIKWRNLVEHEPEKGSRVAFKYGMHIAICRYTEKERPDLGDFSELKIQIGIETLYNIIVLKRPRREVLWCYEDELNFPSEVKNE